MFSYKLVTESGCHLRQIAEYAKEAYWMHRHCRNDYGDVSSGLSSITFKAMKKNQSLFDLMDTSTHSTRPSPKFKAKSPSPLNAMTSAAKKTRGEILHDIREELATPVQDINWDMIMKMVSRTTSSGLKLFTAHIASDEFVDTLQAIDRLSIWDKFLGRSEVKLGY